MSNFYCTFRYYSFPIQLVPEGTFPGLERSVREADLLFPPTVKESGHSISTLLRMSFDTLKQALVTGLTSIKYSITLYNVLRS